MCCAASCSILLKLQLVTIAQTGFIVHVSIYFSTTRNCVVRNYVRPHYWSFKNAKGFTETVNEARYRHMLNTLLRPVVIHLRNRVTTHELWFQRDGVNYHIANETMDVLQGMFGNSIISCRAALTWKPRSLNLNARLLCLGYLKDNIRREIRAICSVT